MTHRAGRFERFVQGTFPGLELGGRLLLLSLVPLAFVTGLGISLIKIGTDGATSLDHVVALVGGLVTLAAIVVFLTAYALVVVRSVRAARSEPPVGRHSSE